MSLENLESSENKESVKNNTRKELQFLKSDIVQVPDALRVDTPHVLVDENMGKKTVVAWEFPERKKWYTIWDKFSNDISSELKYLNVYRKLSDEDYRDLFSWFADVKQWYFWDCYLVSTIKSIARSGYFDTLMITSLQKNSDWSFDLYLPLWSTNCNKIHISEDELNLAQIKWPKWYKILEVWFAKEALLRNHWSQLYAWEMPDIKLTKEAMESIIWWNSYFALATLLWYSNIRRLSITNKPERRSLILRELRRFNPKNLNLMIVSSRRRPKNVSSNQKTYSIWTETMYYHHAYSVYAVEKRGNSIESVILEDPSNNKKKINLSLSWFLSAISQVTTCSLKQWFLPEI